MSSAPGMVKDRVKETSTTTGTGNVTLDGAATGYQTFNAALGTGTYFDYCIAAQGGADWEVGCGYLSGATTLVRDSVYDSSNAGAAVSFSAGTKDVFLTFAARSIQQTASLGIALLIKNGTFIP